MKKPTLYIVIPCYNEESVLPITGPLFSDKLSELEEEELIAKGVTFVDCNRQSFIDITSQLGYELQDTDLFKTEKLYEKVLQWNAEFDAANQS